MTKFEDLDDDVLYMILDYLYLERYTVLQTLRLTSSRLKEFSDAVTHRHLTLVDDDLHERLTYRLTERLNDSSDKLRHYVRNLHVVDFKGDEKSYCLNSALITDCISHIQRLDVITWNCDAPISPNILGILRQRFPQALLYANVRFINRELFLTEKLHKLEVSVPCADLSGTDSISLFRSLKQAVLQLHGLRHFILDTHHEAKVVRMEGAALDSLHLPLASKDKLPALATLRFTSTSYNFSAEHCAQLLASIDCTKIQHLALGNSNPINFFQTFLGRLPHLKHLEISYASTRDDPRNLRLGACSYFISELPSLQSLTLQCDSLDLREELPRTLADTQGPHLLHLSLQARQQNLAGPVYRGNIRKFLYKFENLQSLDMAFPDIHSYHRCPDCEGFEWGQADHFSFVPPHSSLREVRLSIKAPFTERSLFTYINKHAHCAICHLWTTFVDQADSQLETLSIRFWRWEVGRQTHLKELIYDTTRLRGCLFVKVRHHREIPTVVYKEVWEGREDRRALVAFEA